jgi:outer membrane protein assembly factor BamB
MNPENGNIIWKSTPLVMCPIAFGATFANNGDIIITAPNRTIIRIDHNTGKLVWSVQRSVPVSPDYEGIAVSNETVYTWEGTINTPLKLLAIDAKNGNKKYSIEIPSVNPSSLAKAPFPVIGQNGNIYALKNSDNLVALKDNGESLSILWNIPLDVNSGYGSPAVGPDGSIYFYLRSRIMRANHVNGKIIDSSKVVWKQFNRNSNFRFAIDAEGKVYYTHCNIRDNFSCFTKKLEFLWNDTVPGMYLGFTLGSNGTLAVSGKNDELRIYSTNVNSIINNKYPISNLAVYHKFSHNKLIIRFYSNINKPVVASIIALNGRTLIEQKRFMLNSECNTMEFDCSNFSNGIYLYKLKVKNMVVTKLFNVLR